MEQAIDVEAEPKTTAITVRPASAVGQALTVSEILAQVKLIQDVMRQVMIEGEHYGKVPGCGEKKTLLQPGAQKLTMTFRLAPEYEIQEVNLERGHKEYRVVCTLKSIQSGNFIGQGVGCCSSMESKYRFRKVERACPKCGKHTIVAGKEEYGGGWLCWKKKGGCGEKFQYSDPAIQSQEVGQTENENPADTFNTVLKMAKKRAFVDATITATAASDIFTQDIGDDEAENDGQPEPTGAPGKSKAPTTPPKAAPSPAPAPKPTAPVKLPTDATRTWAINELKAAPGEANHDTVVEYFRALSQLMPNEDVTDLPLRFVPATHAELRALVTCIGDFSNGDRALAAFKPHGEADTEPEKPAEVPREKPVPPKAPKVIDRKDPLWWKGVIVPVPHRGEKRSDYMRNPETIGFLYDQRHEQTADGEDSRRRLFGFIQNYEAKGWQKQDGTAMPPSEGDILFREALSACAEYHEREHPDEKL